MYVIKNTETGKYVAKSGLKNSYTKKLDGIRLYPTKESAEADRCPENEIIIDISMFQRDLINL